MMGIVQARRQGTFMFYTVVDLVAEDILTIIGSSLAAAGSDQKRATSGKLPSIAH